MQSCGAGNALSLSIRPSRMRFPSTECFVATCAAARMLCMLGSKESSYSRAQDPEDPEALCLSNPKRRNFLDCGSRLPCLKL